MHQLDKGVDKVLIAFCTFPDADTARKIVREIIDANLAACGNVIPQIESIYRWQGKVEESKEVLLIIKTTEAAAARVKDAIREMHSYELPECIVISITDGSESYLKWIAESVD